MFRSGTRGSSFRRMKILFEDLGSSNGTFLDNERIRKPLLLHPPQTLRLGSVQLEIRFVAGQSQHRQPTKPSAPAPASREESLKKARNYSMGELLARGGMGTVLRANDRNLGR